MNRKELVKTLFYHTSDFVRNKDPKLAKEIVLILTELNAMKDVKTFIELAREVNFDLTDDIEYDTIETLGSIIDTISMFDDEDDGDIYYLYAMSCKLMHYIEVLLGKKLEEIVLQS